MVKTIFALFGLVYYLSFAYTYFQDETEQHSPPKLAFMNNTSDGQCPVRPFETCLDKRESSLCLKIVSSHSIRNHTLSRIVVGWKNLVCELTLTCTMESSTAEHSAK